MPNPFLAKKEYIIPYAAVWILIAGIHAAVLYFFSERLLLEASVDALIFNIILAGLGLSVWYAIRYYDSSNSTALDTLLYHLVTGTVALTVWLASGYFLVRISLPDFESYREFLNESMPWRGISGLLVYSLMVLVYYLYINLENAKEQRKKQDELQLQVREAEIDRIKAQINPHFLFNSLNSVSSLTLTSPEGAREMLVKLSSFLRYSLEFKENELTNLSDELDHIEQYLAIEKVRFGKRMQPDIQYGDDCKDCRLPNMILQPLFENAIKHGVYESTDPVEIKTHIRKEGDILRISLFNPFDPEAPPRKGKGIGLRHVANRLSLVYQLDNLMHVDKADNTFTVTLIIPQITIS